jgi:hypothetical protein
VVQRYKMWWKKIGNPYMTVSRVYAHVIRA